MSPTADRTPSDPGARRPIAARGLAVIRAAAARLARAGVTPNAISLSGMGCGLLAGVALWGTAAWPSAERALWIAAAALVQLRLLANLLDGLVAVEGGLGTPAGELFNEVPDRVSDAATLIGLGYAAGGAPALGYGAALAAVLAAYVRAQAVAAGAPNDFCGPLAKPQRMAVVTAVALWLGFMPDAWRPEVGLASIALVVLIVGALVTALRRLRRAVRALQGRAP